MLAGGGSLPAAQDSPALVCPVVAGPETGVCGTCGLVTGLYFYESASPFGPMGQSRFRPPFCLLFYRR